MTTRGAAASGAMGVTPSDVWNNPVDRPASPHIVEQRRVERRKGMTERLRRASFEPEGAQNARVDVIRLVGLAYQHVEERSIGVLNLGEHLILRLARQLDERPIPGPPGRPVDLPQTFEE